MFAWNGKHADQFMDNNLEFRRSVLEYFIDHKSQFPIELVADLYEAETQFAEEAWGVNPVVSNLAQELLERGRTTFVADYLKGWGRGMDAFCQAQEIDLSIECLEELLEYCRENENTGVFPNTKQLEMLKEYFQWKLEKKR